MIQLNYGSYKIEVFKDDEYSFNSVDNLNQYDLTHIDPQMKERSAISKHGIKVSKKSEVIRSALVAASGGATGVHKNSVILDNDRLLVCCCNTVFCLNLTNLELLWKTQADTGTCFEIFKYLDSYIVHGELEITRINKSGELLWQKSGADIFTTPEGKDTFKITDEYILATDWENRKYKFDFDGNLIE